MSRSADPTDRLPHFIRKEAPMSERIARYHGNFIDDVAEAPRVALTAGPEGEESQAGLRHEICSAQETSVHPGVVKIILGATAWFLIVTWISFARGGEVDLNLAVVILFFLFFLGLFLLTSSFAVNDPRWRQRDTSFREFLKSEVSTATGKMRGRDVLIEIATVPVSLAFAATVIGLIWVAIH
jgi:hypothetical protein